MFWEIRIQDSLGEHWYLYVALHCHRHCEDIAENKCSENMGCYLLVLLIGLGGDEYHLCLPVVFLRGLHGASLLV